MILNDLSLIRGNVLNVPGVLQLRKDLEYLVQKNATLQADLNKERSARESDAKAAQERLRAFESAWAGRSQAWEQERKDLQFQLGMANDRIAPLAAQVRLACRIIKRMKSRIKAWEQEWEESFPVAARQQGDQ